MGVYLSTPNTEKKSCDETCTKLTYGSSSMQGWRMSQEDAHNCLPDFDENTSLFAVYDGHGGAEVAQYCATNLPQFIKETNHYKEGKLADALVEAYLGFDALLTLPSVVKELKVMAGVESDEEETPAKKRSEAELLRLEADMPIEELMAKYETGDSVQPRTRILRKKPQVNSPVIKPKRLPFPTESSDANENANTELKLDEKVTNGHAENENNINLEKESQMSSSSSSSVQNDTVSSSVNSSSEKPPQNTSSTQQDSSACSLSCDSISSNQMKDAGSSSSSTEIGAISSSSHNDSSSECSSQSKQNENRCIEPECSSSNNSDHNQTAETGIDGTKQELPDEDCAAGSSTQSTTEENAVCSSINEAAGSSSSGVKSKDEDGDFDEDYDEEEDVDFSGDEEDDEDVEFDSEEEGEDDESDEDEEDIDEVEIVEDEAIAEEPGSDSGSTAVVALIRNKEIYVANAGDSRCILCRAGKAIDLSIDHKPEDDTEKNRIQAAGGKVTEEGRVNGGLNMSRAIGDHFYKRNTSKSPKEQMITALPDIMTETLQENDEFLVLACDGIWNSMSSQEVVDFVKEKLKDEQNKKQLSLICEQLFNRCLAPNTMGDGTGCDNMTCIIVTFDQIWNNNKNKRHAEETEEVLDKRRKTEEIVT